MAETYTLQNAYSATVQFPDDGDIINEANREPGMKAAADNTRWAYERVNAQHVNGGNHNQIVVATLAAGEIGVDIESDVAEAANQVKLRVQDLTPAVTFSVTSAGDIDAHSADIGKLASGAGGLKLTVRTRSTDAGTVKQIILYDQAGVESMSIQADGTINTNMPTWPFFVAPGRFHGTLDNAGANDASGVLYEFGAAFNMSSAGAAGTAWRGMCPVTEFREGDTISNVLLNANMTNVADSITLTLKGKTAYATVATIGTCTITGVTGHQTAALLGAPYLVVAGISLYWEILLTDSAAPGNIAFEGINGTIDRSLVR